MGPKISRRKHVKFLGIFVDDKLNWNEQIHFCKQKKNSFCPVCTKNCRQYLNVEAAKNSILLSNIPLHKLWIPSMGIDLQNIPGTNNSSPKKKKKKNISHSS